MPRRSSRLRDRRGAFIHIRRCEPLAGGSKTGVESLSEPRRTGCASRVIYKSPTAIKLSVIFELKGAAGIAHAVADT